MATRPLLPNQSSATASKRFTRPSSPRRTTCASPSRLRPASGSRPSGDLAGRSVALAATIPAIFDAPLEPHYRAIGQWVAAQGEAGQCFTRHEARKHIERTFDRAVLDIVGCVDMLDLRAIVINGNDDHPPAIALICDSVGQVELGWIEKCNVLSQTMLGPVAPLGWRAAAYKALTETIPSVLPVFGFEDLMEELSAYYWDGETEDREAIASLMQWQGHALEDIDEEMLPSAIRGRRPEWMLTENAAPLSKLPKGLRSRIRAVRSAADTVIAQRSAAGAWNYESDLAIECLPEYEERAFLAPMTLVCAEAFARELDDVGRHGMEIGFMDVVGMATVTDAADIDAWFQSLKVGVEFMRAAQDLIAIDPTSGKDRR
ncbi:hypothetical protein [Novosphingobium resinovorum]|uniref:PRTRC system protein F n=1 Tax=Novosphingobium resinovorum TaxID=158500 RepID=A0A1D8A2K7_9SPHN|nr:hypothetical protein [Novosphingobium resinovorum]AOR76300.1 hypothetical protein BES08_05655 [Novosphingobium resinovorum]